jgi:hypothetical protein
LHVIGETVVNVAQEEKKRFLAAWGVLANPVYGVGVGSYMYGTPRSGSAAR